ncbi:FIP1[V]-like protein isoform X2 [Aristolochia californica]|uniref:FIP1[V]-like protein isoform X2 n=1 Tax=Aristolochia californica TaxID=171875 RepID=UPI0035DB5D6B
MEDEDEFGDLYTDVLRPPSSATPPHRPPLFLSSSSTSALPSAGSLFQSHEDDGDEDDDFLSSSAPASGYKPPSQTLAPLPNRFVKEDSARERRPDVSTTSPYRKETNWDGNAIFDAREPETAEVPVRNEDLAGVSDERGRVLESRDGEDRTRGLDDMGRGEIPEAQGENAVLSGEKMGINVGVGDLDAELVIPGLFTDTFVSLHGPDEVNSHRGNQSVGVAAAAAAGDDSDSDSEDDLQIVLNDNTASVGAERNEGVGIDDDDDEDGEDLVIVADDGALLSQPMEDRDWGEESAPAAADGERKDGAEVAKINGGQGGAVGARIGFSNHGYHPHHSQFKYVRPGASVPPPGTVAASNGASGLVRPPLTMGPVAGRGRGDWRPMGMKSMPTMQKSFQYGSSVWANSSSGRPFGGGMEFTLPSHKTVFDVDIDSFEEKPWKYPGVDISNYFNFGLDEDHWKEYCKQLGQLRLEATMQSKIRVYESGRSEQDYDPDLPPELAAATGLHDASVDNANQGKTEVGQGDFMGQGRSTTRIRPPLPTGRAIQVEGGYSERLPSIDTRPPRNRDSDSIIEIICQDTINDDAVTSNGTSEPENETQVEESKGSDEIEEDECGSCLPSTYDNRKREKMESRTPDMGRGRDDVIAGGGLPSCPSEAPVSCNHISDSQGQVYTSGESGPSLGGRLPQEAPAVKFSEASGDNACDVKSHHCSHMIKADIEQNEKSKVDFEGKQVPEGSSPEEVEAVKELSLERRDDVPDDQLALADSTEYEGDEVASDLRVPGETQEESSLDHSKKQTLSSRVESATQQIENGDQMRPAHSDSSKARSGSSRDYQRRKEGGEDEVVQGGRSRCVGEARRVQDGDEPIYRRRVDYGRDGRQEAERNHLVLRGRDDTVLSYLHRDWDSSLGHYSRVKGEGLERQKERDSSVGTWQRRDEDVQRRRTKDEEIIKRRDRVEETGSRHRSRVRESERTEKDDHVFSRKRVEDGDWRGRYEKEIRSTKQREREDIAMGRHESLDDSHLKKRKEDGPQKRGVDKEEMLHGYRAREETRKRERDDLVDSRRRDDPARQRDKPDEHHQSVRHREENWRQREREDRQRVKQVVEENKWVGSGRTKDESKGLGSEKDYSHRDKRRHIELPKRRERLEEDISLQHRGREDVYPRDNPYNYEEKNSRHDRSTGQNDRLVGPYKEKRKENPRKIKESEVSDQNVVGHGRRQHDDHGTHKNEKVSMRSTSVQESNIVSPSDPIDSQDYVPSRSSTATVSKKGHHHHHHHHEQTQHPSRKREEDGTNDEVQHSSQRGRTKLERWTSQKERDINPNSNSHSSSVAKSAKESGNIDGRFIGTEQPVERDETAAAVNNEKNGDLNKDSDVGHSSENKKVDLDKVDDDRHMDAVAKLKKRSERFKLPMPSEKDSSTNRRVENEAVASQSENPTTLEIKQERPTRKRRWVAS